MQGQLDWLINQGQRMLDGMVETSKSRARHIVQITQGNFIAYIKNVRAIEDVWVADADGRTQLTRRNWEHLRTNYTTPVSELDEGTPIDFLDTIIGLSPELFDQKASDFSGTLYDYEDIFFYDDSDPTDVLQHVDRNGLLFMPPADGAFTLNVVGQFWSKWLTAAADVSYWTELHDGGLLVPATLAKMEELMFRNTEGVNGYIQSINFMLQGVTKGVTASMAAGTSLVMKG